MSDRITTVFLAAFFGLGVGVVLWYVRHKLNIVLRSHSTDLLEHDKTRNMVANELRQLESLVSLQSLLSFPVPKTGGWAASPDFLNELSLLILSRQPETVVEASSGVSTLIIGHCLQKLGGGHVYSLEHDPEFFNKTQALVAIHDLSEYCTVVLAPLVEHSVGRESYCWYELEQLDAVSGIDLLVVDGPPGASEHGYKARFPALPLLNNKLHSDSAVFLDDANRRAETEAIQKWIENDPSWHCECFSLEKGGALLTRQPVAE